jgi:lipopolysaccharide transport system ATP-binding protein
VHPVEELAIELHGVVKQYSLESRPGKRLIRQLTGKVSEGPVYEALHDIDLKVRKGEVVGLIGRNGAGKSTLLQVVCGVLTQTRGTRVVNGRIAALLELGAGFNTELTGRENVRFNGPLLGMDAREIEKRLPSIIEFAGIGDFIDQPVRTYSSGMFNRLAFAMATSVDPDILVIDEALSVGDGAFSRKSFERIMQLRDRGATILFCSHSLFQVEALCARAIWLHEGRIQYDGPVAEAIVEYQTWLDRNDSGLDSKAPAGQRFDSPQASLADVSFADGSRQAKLRTSTDTLAVRIKLRTDPALPCPTVGVVVHGADGRSVTSAGTWVDGLALQRDAAGNSTVEVSFPEVAILKGHYTVSAYALCERGLNVLSAAEHVLALEMEQDNLELGVVRLPRSWTGRAGIDKGEA